MRSRSCPARPTKGSPCSSSSAAGASPTKHREESGLPREKTVCVRVVEREQRVQEETSRARAGRRRWRSGVVAGAGAGAGGGEGAVAGVVAGAGGGEGAVAVVVAGAGAVAVAPPAFLLGNPVAPVSFCHSTYARTEAAISASSFLGSVVIG